MQRTVLGILLLGIGLSAHADTYKCTATGRVVYQDTPCAEPVPALNLDTRDTGIGGLRQSEIAFYFTAVEADIDQITPHGAGRLGVARAHIQMLKKLCED